MACIYGLYDRAGALRYIGKANDPDKRLASHLRDARRRDTPLYRWIRKNGCPTIRILEADCANWREAEKRLISNARARGEKLLNVADGGDEPFCPIEVRRSNARKLASSVVGMHADPVRKRVWEIKRSLAQGIREGLVCNRTRANMREAARIAPHLFGAWANIEDREEDNRGEPIGGYVRKRHG